MTRAEEIKSQNDEIARRFGDNLRRTRKRAGLSQVALAERVHLHRTEIGLIEHGLRAGRIDTLIKLAGALEVDAVDLLDGIDWVVAEPRRGNFALGGVGTGSSKA